MESTANGAPVNWDSFNTIPMPTVGEERVQLLRDAFDLIVDLWPDPVHKTITLETHQWVKLRRVLLSIPDLMTGEL